MNAPAADPPAAAEERVAARAPCPNCGAPLLGEFCYACGQSKRGLIRHFTSIVGDFLDTVFNIDSRTLRTLWPLYFKPGYLSNEYFAGRRVRYVTPLRLYFFLSIVLFLLISLVSRGEFTGPQEGGSGLRIDGSNPAEQLAELAPAERKAKLDQLEAAMALAPTAVREEVRREIEAELARADEERAAEAKAAKPVDAKAASKPEAAAAEADEPARDDEEPGERKPSITLFGGKPWHKTDNPLLLSWLPDAANGLLNDEIEVLINKAQKIKDDPGPFVRQMFSTAPQALFLILPLFALLLKFFYAFKRRLFMEHLIVALHSHSFICFSLIVVVLLFQLRNWLASAGEGFVAGLLGLMIGFAWAWIPLYLLVMQKRVYRQGWFFTLLKYGCIGICYTVLLTFGMLLTMLVSLVLL
jgi:hypothetical protein